jgi:hypothetical protein
MDLGLVFERDCFVPRNDGLMRINKMKKALKWLLIVTFLKELVFVGLTPLWHFPDEQAHWATVQLFGEVGSFKKKVKKGGNLAEEIWISEKLLGTDRDEQGNNKFTYHPEYRIEYTDTQVGKYEEEIVSLPKESRTKWVKSEAAKYPPLYYWLGARVYRLVYEGNLLVRVFVVRAVQSLLMVGTVYLAWKIGKVVFVKETLSARFLDSAESGSAPLGMTKQKIRNGETKALALAWLVSFHPMLSFVGAGVNSDNLFNLLFTAWLYWSVLVISKGITGKRLAGLLIILAVGFYTKPQMVVALGLTPIAIAVAIVKNSIRSTSSEQELRIKCWRIKDWVILVGGLALLVGAGVWAITKGPAEWVLTFVRERSYSPVNPVGLVGHIKWSLAHTIREVIPWYWGVFNWLGVVLPRWVNRVQARLLIISAVGIGWWAVRHVLGRHSREGGNPDWIPHQVRDDKSKRENIPTLLWLWFVAGAYFAAVTVWDWLFIRSHGFSFGIQGRYFFPTVVAHMSLILVGLTVLVPKKWEKKLLLALGAWWLVMNVVAIVTVAGAYYDLSSVNTFLIQMSQYKPWFFKAPGWLGVVGLWVFSLVILVRATRQRLGRLDY